MSIDVVRGRRINLDPGDSISDVRTKETSEQPGLYAI